MAFHHRRWMGLVDPRVMHRDDVNNLMWQRMAGQIPNFDVIGRHDFSPVPGQGWGVSRSPYLTPHDDQAHGDVDFGDYSVLERTYRTTRCG